MKQPTQDCEGYDSLSIKIPGRELFKIAHSQAGRAPGMGSFWKCPIPDRRPPTRAHGLYRAAASKRTGLRSARGETLSAGSSRPRRRTRQAVYVGVDVGELCL